MYLDSDCVLALIKDSDWLKNTVKERVSTENELFTSAVTIIECKLVISREEQRELMHDIDSKIIEAGIQLLPFNLETDEISNKLLKKYEFLGIFDSIHAATSILHELILLSTDHIFPLMEEVRSEDPRK